MTQKQRDQYLSLRHELEPMGVTLVIRGDLPPASGKYFYDSKGKMNKKQGWILVDSSYEPVNALDERNRDLVIIRGNQALCDDAKRLLRARWNEVALILIKANVCKLLDARLKEAGFNVLNKGRTVFFPSSGRQRDFDS